MAKRLVLLDGHAIIHRAYHALPPLTSSSGQLVNAVYGFVSMLLRVIDELKPTYLAVCFDLPIPTFRHEAYIAYQAKRPVMDKELSGQIELVHEVVAAAGIPIYTSPGFEADDVIGTLAEQAAKTKNSKLKTQNYNSKIKTDETIVVTGDRDILQLVNKNTKVYMTIRGLSEAKMFDEKEVEEYMGIKPSQIVDYKALIGDASDNYPGVPGIGPKTAIALLDEFQSVDGIYKAIKNKKTENISRVCRFAINHNLLQKLKEGKEAAMLSQDLARIRTDAPVELDLEKAKVVDLAKNEKFIEKLRELRFKSLVARLVTENSSSLSPSKSKKSNGQMGLI